MIASPQPVRWQRIMRGGAALLLALTCAFTSIVASAQTPIVTPGIEFATAPLSATTATTIDFPTGITFDATLTEADDAEISLLYQVGDLAVWNLALIDADAITRAADGTLAIHTTIDLQRIGVPAGIPLTFHWRATMPDGVIRDSASETISWYDTRYDWSTLSSEQIDLHYVDLDDDVAAQILTSAQSTVTDLESRYALERSRTLQIWVYPDSESLRGTLPANSRDTIAGGSFIGYSLIVALIPNGSTGEIGRIIPHEVSHQVLYQATQNPFTILPTWFDEGMATHIQNGGTSSYLGLVINAWQHDALFDLASISAGFPYTPSQATLAYAASWSAIAYIQETYGDDGISRLIAAFATGAPEQDVILQALGITLDQLDDDWKAWIGAQAS